jgi:hypothetical protein
LLAIGFAHFLVSGWGNAVEIGTRTRMSNLLAYRPPHHPG